MLDTFTAYAHTETTDADGMTVRAWVQQYVTPGKVSGRSRQGDTNTRTVTVGGVERLVIEGGIHVPLDAAVPEVGWQLLCTAVGGSSDPALVGRRWQVVDVPAKSYATARRLDVVEMEAS